MAFCYHQKEKINHDPVDFLKKFTQCWDSGFVNGPKRRQDGRNTRTRVLMTLRKPRGSASED